MRPCQGRDRGFEPRRSRRDQKNLFKNEQIFCFKLGSHNFAAYEVARNHNIFVQIIGTEVARLEDGEYSMMWEVYPQGIYDLLMRIWKDYRPTCEILITENGIPLLDIDYKTLQRTIKESGQWFHKVIRANGFPLENG